jgi:outer membrane beta-barrel protein
MRALISCAIVLSSVFGRAHAAGLDLDPNEIRGVSTKKQVAVLQNRFFLKAMRPEIGLFAGTILNEAYTNTRFAGARIGLFFNEWVGIEMQYVKANVGETEDKKALNKLRYRTIEDGPNGEVKIVSPDPETNPISSMQDFTVVGAPLYGKLNLLDFMILYSDLYGVFGFSRVDTAQGIKNAVLVGAGQRFYIQKNWSLRIDFRDRTYVETRNGQDTRKHAWSTDLGVSFFFL